MKTTHTKNKQKPNTSRQKPSFFSAAMIPLLIVLLAIVFAANWFRPGTALEAEEEPFTAVSHDKTNFPLQGKHRDTSCSECHLKGVMQGTPQQCEACHWQRKQDDRYKLQLGMHCEDCHTPFDWKILKPNAWSHLQVAGYALEGIHKTLDCFQCHKNNTFTAQPNDCYACHAADYQEADEPNHTAGNFPTDCRVCHGNMISWEGAAFNHTIYPLRGAHQAADCGRCHHNGQYAGTTQECFGCHLDDYNGAQDPNHQQAGYPTDCESCHGNLAVTWDGAQLDHSKFPLQGNHLTALCSACHSNGQYTGTTQECSGCHMDDYNNTTAPNHQQAGYSTDCQNCHGNGAGTWLGATVDHSKFPLLGNHKTAVCTDCHKNNQYTGTTQLCSGCHMTDYNKTTTPNHQQSGYSTDCENCHGNQAVTWKGATVDHSKFPLLGSHKTADCTDCHKNNQYTGTTQLCSGCHMSEYNKTTAPNHQQSGYSTDCESCHGNQAITWLGAVVDHSKFPLKGAHLTAECTDCHSGGQYSGLSQECYSCHKDKYDATVNPNHQQAGFSNDCIPCHGTEAVTWSGAVFNHNLYFQLQGAHVTLDCNDCHAGGYDLPTDCYGCHRQNYENTTSPNHQATGFPTTCESCHFSTHLTWGQAVFNHQFPINSGKHANINCTECHLTANYQVFSCIDCHEHNKSDTDRKHNDVRSYSYNSQACYSCHPEGRED